VKRAGDPVIYAVIILLSLPLVSAESTVSLENLVRLEDADLGLEGATISPNGEIVLAHGADSAVFLIDPENPENNSRLDPQLDSILYDSSFHPGSRSALIVGDGGLVLRLLLSNNSIERVGGNLEFGNTDLFAVSWNGDGSWAYVGGESGWIWRIRGFAEGGLEAIPLEGRGESDVNGISCISGLRVCVISSSVDGIGIIDENHRISWIGAVGHPWVDVVCPSVSQASCVCVSTDLTIAVVTINDINASRSTIFDNDIVQLQGVEGKIRGIVHQYEGRSLISVEPFGLIEHDLGERISFEWVGNSDAVNFSVRVSDESIASTWGNGAFDGWLITKEGTMVSFSIHQEDNEGGILGIWIGVVIIGGTVLLLVSLLTSSSPKLSRIMAKWIGSEEERKRAIREERVRTRKRKRA